jgi:hypothetical protein
LEAILQHGIFPNEGAITRLIGAPLLEQTMNGRFSVAAACAWKRSRP